MSGPPVTIVAANAPPRVQVATGAPVAVPVTGNAPPITLVSANAPPIVLINDDGTAYNWDNAFFYADLTRNLVYYNGATLTLASVSGYSFARASTAYYTDASGQLIQFASGQPRIGNRGLLVEGAGTNLILQSQTFQTTWTVTRCLAFGSGSVADAIAAPDGTLTADKVVEDTTASNTHRIQQSITVSSGTAYTWSIYAKAAERSIITLQFTDGTTTGFCYFNLSGAGSTGSSSGVSATSITALANGWYRCAITMTTAATAGIAQIFLSTSTSSNSYTGDGVSGLYLWGAQLEATAFATSYIPTTTGSLARAADVLSIGSITGLAYTNGVTLFAEFERAADSGLSSVLFGLNDGDADEEVIAYIDSSDRFAIQSKNATVTQANELVTGALAVGTVYRAAGRIATNDVKAARGGSLSSGDASATNPATPTTIKIGSRFAADLYGFVYLRRLAIYPTAYSDAQLQAITT